MWNRNLAVNKQLVEAFNDFKAAYNKLNNMLADTDVNMLTLNSAADYPFEHDFDSYAGGVDYWCSSSVNELEETNERLETILCNTKKQIASISKSDQGGGCIVTIIKFVLTGCPQWMYLSDDGYVIVSHNYLEDPDYYDKGLYDADECIIYNFQADCGDWDADTALSYKYLASFVRSGLIK